MASRQTAQKLETCQLASAAIKSHEERVWSNKTRMLVYDFSEFVKSLNYLMMPAEIKHFIFILSLSCLDLKISV